MHKIKWKKVGTKITTAFNYILQHINYINCQCQLDHQKSKRVPEKTSTSALLTMPKPLTVWITTNSGNFLKI